jgi:Family of unknown function (DUF6599)
MFQNWVRSCLLLLILATALQAQGPRTTLPGTLVEAVNSLPGWVASGKSETFNESNIEKFDLKPVTDLRALGLNNVTVQTWQSPTGQVRAELFQFIDFGAAYSFFTNQRRLHGGVSSAFSAGAESFQDRNFSYFWQANYIVRLNGESRAIESLAEILSKNILGRSQRPAISNRLPATNLIPGSEEYILDAANIQKVEGVDPSALGFEVSAEATTADYRINGKTVRLLLVLYPTQQIAKKFADQMNAATPNLAASRRRVGPLVAIVSGTSDPSAIESLLGQVHYVSNVMWEEPKPGLGLGPIIVTVFTFIGLLLGVCVVAGFGLGGARLVMKSFFPNRVFDRPGQAEFIQLKLDQELTRKEIGE